MANTNPQNKPDGICRWFLLCDKPVTDSVKHPILGDVPCCAGCAAFARGERK